MIIKKLKNYLWEYDEEKKEMFLTFQPYGIEESMPFVIDKVRMLSLMRFMIRVLARMSTHKRHSK